MAKRRDPTEAERKAQSNSKMRLDVQRECATQMRDIKKERKELTARTRAIRERLDNCGINVKAFEHALRLADMDDEVARNDYLKGLHESWEALGTGRSLDWVEELERHEEDVAGANAEEERAETEAVH